MFSHFNLFPECINFKLLSFIVVDFLDTGQSWDRGLLSVNGSVGGSPVELKDGVMAYCSEQANPWCMLTCTVRFDTIHSPSYFLNGSCFSTGENGTDLQEIGVHASHKHPSYTTHFPCHAISNYTCYMNSTVYTQVGVHPGKPSSALWLMHVPSNRSRVLSGSVSKLIGHALQLETEWRTSITCSGALFPDLVMPHSIVHTVLITQEWCLVIASFYLWLHHSGTN